MDKPSGSLILILIVAVVVLMGCHSHNTRIHPIFVGYESKTKDDILAIFGPPPVRASGDSRWYYYFGHRTGGQRITIAFYEDWVESYCEDFYAAAEDTSYIPVLIESIETSLHEGTSLRASELLVDYMRSLYHEVGDTQSQSYQEYIRGTPIELGKEMDPRAWIDWYRATRK